MRLKGLKINYLTLPVLEYYTPVVLCHPDYLSCCAKQNKMIQFLFELHSLRKSRVTCNYVVGTTESIRLGRHCNAHCNKFPSSFSDKMDPRFISYSQVRTKRNFSLQHRYNFLRKIEERKEKYKLKDII